MKGSYGGSSMHLVGGRGGAKQRKRKGVSKVFRAKYRGTCSACGREVRKGQTVMVEQPSNAVRHAYRNSCGNRSETER